MNQEDGQISINYVTNMKIVYFSNRACPTSETETVSDPDYLIKLPEKSKAKLALESHERFDWC